jgi:hypothetical protein
MFTQAMPAYVNALRSGQIPQAMQALGNCQQPLTHRGGVNFTPAGANNRGVYTSQPWNPGSYPGLRPDTPQGDLPGMTTNWNYGNRYDSQFYFPTNQLFTQNQFFGGPNIRYEGGMQGDWYEGDTINVRLGRLRGAEMETINGEPIDPLPGPQGEAGRDGLVFGGAFRYQPKFGVLFYLQAGLGGPRILQNKIQVAAVEERVEDLWKSPLVNINVPTNAISGASVTVGGQAASLPTNAISGGTVTITGQAASLPTNAISGGSVTLGAVAVTVPTGVTFDADACQVTWTGTTVLYALTAADAVTFTGAPASTATVHVLSGSAVTAAVDPQPASTATVHVLSGITVAATVTPVPAAAAAVLGVTTASSAKDSAGGQGVVIQGIRKKPEKILVLQNADLAGIDPAADVVVIG